MTIEFRKKYEIVTSVIDNCGNEPFTINSLYVACEKIAQQYGLSFNSKDVLCVLSDLYDGFEINREVSEDGTVSFRRTAMFGVYEDKVSSR